MASARPNLLRVLLSAAPLLLLALPAAATSYVMVEDAKLADQAAVVAEVKVDWSHPAPLRQSAGTDYQMEVLRVLKGSTAGSSIVVRVPGGKRADGMSLILFGTPRFREGDRALLFLTERADGTYGILHLLLGAFHEGEANGRQVVLRNLSQATEVRLLTGGGAQSMGTTQDRPRDLERFASWIADRTQGVTRKADYFATLPKSALSRLTAKFTLFSDAGEYLRWFDFDSGGSIVWNAYQSGQGGVPGGGFAEFQNALSAWNADPLTPISYVYGGTTSASALGKPPGGCPSRPSKSSTTLSGKASSRSGSSVSSGVRLFATRNRAMSPTTFDVGVTFTMSPKSRFTSAYALQTSGHRAARPRPLACWNRFVYWPPGIS